MNPHFAIETTSSPAQCLQILQDLSKDFFSEGEFPVYFLLGEMGTGKTTLVREWFQDSCPFDFINSPTYNLHNEYQSSRVLLHHFDLYRIQDAEEIEVLGFYEIWGKQDLSLIEWASKGGEKIISLKRIEILIEYETESSRKYCIAKRESYEKSPFF